LDGSGISTVGHVQFFRRRKVGGKLEKSCFQKARKNAAMLGPDETWPDVMFS